MDCPYCATVLDEFAQKIGEGFFSRQQVFFACSSCGYEEDQLITLLDIIEAKRLLDEMEEHDSDGA